jgi:hypothetical protein
MVTDGNITIQQISEKWGFNMRTGFDSSLRYLTTLSPLHTFRRVLW